jgi:hypothetical protein
MLIHRTHFDPEDGGRIYFQNVDNTSHIHMVQRLKSRINGSICILLLRVSQIDFSCNRGTVAFWKVDINYFNIFSLLFLFRRK